MEFLDRKDAALRLAQELKKHRLERPVVYAIPRGAVPMGEVLAEQLQADLDVVLVHKLGAPGDPEYAIGAVAESGEVFLRPDLPLEHIPAEYIHKAARAQVEALKVRRRLCSAAGPSISPEGRTAVVVDDGIATGATTLAAVRAIRAKRPLKLIVAAPVASPVAVVQLRHEADEVIILYTPPLFFAVGNFYRNFEQVSDEQVLEILLRARAQARFK